MNDIIKSGIGVMVVVILSILSIIAYLVLYFGVLVLAAMILLWIIDVILGTSLVSTVIGMVM